MRFRALPKPSAEELVTLDAKGRKARIAPWAEQNKDRSEKDRLLDSVRTQPNLGSAYFEDLVDKLVKLDARDVVPVILAHLDRPGLAGYERESISAPALASTGGARSSALEAR